MKAKIFTKEDHPEYGHEGWRPVLAFDADPLQGMGTAHDCLEHFEDDIGRIHDEIQALGAAMYIRGDGGWWNRQSMVSCPGYHIAGDMPDIFRHELEGMDFKTPPKTKPLTESWAESYIDSCIEHSREHLNDYFRNDIEEEDWTKKWIEDNLKKLQGWLRIGYRRAKRRYPCPCQATYMFNDLAQRCDELLGIANYGQEMRVVVNIRRATVEAELIYPADEIY